MNNRKQFIAVLLALLIVLTASACGKSEAPTKASEPAVQETTTTEAAPVEEKVVFSTGTVKVNVPQDWIVIGANETMDGYNDKEANINGIYLCKGAKSDMDVFDFPGIQVTYYGANTIMLGATKDFYENTKDVDPINLDNYEWSGFSAESMGAPLTILFANPDDGEGDQFQVAVWQEMGGKTIALDDADVLEIISSIQPAK